MEVVESLGVGAETMAWEGDPSGVRRGAHVGNMRSQTFVVRSPFCLNAELRRGGICWCNCGR